MNQRKSKRQRRRNRKTGEMELQITALADILIILLVFLLKSYSTGLDTLKDVSVHAKVRIPTVSRTDTAPRGLKIEVLSDRINLEGQTTSRLSSYRFLGGDLQKELENSSISRSLASALSGARKKYAQLGNRIWLVADERAPYQTIQTILASAAVYGYSEINLVVMKGE